MGFQLPVPQLVNSRRISNEPSNSIKPGKAEGFFQRSIPQDWAAGTGTSMGNLKGFGLLERWGHFQELIFMSPICSATYYLETQARCGRFSAGHCWSSFCKTLRKWQVWTSARCWSTWPSRMEKKTTPIYTGRHGYPSFLCWPETLENLNGPMTMFCMSVWTKEHSDISHSPQQPWPARSIGGVSIPHRSSRNSSIQKKPAPPPKK